MRRSDILLQCLDELTAGTSSQSDLMPRDADQQKELQTLLAITSQLQALPKNVCLSETTKTRIRAQLLAEARQPASQSSLGARWKPFLDSSRRALQLFNLTPRLARPVAIALSLLLSFSLLSASTVSAAMDSIPGDSLYSVKTLAEQARLAFSFNENDKAEAYLWIASSRVEELGKIAESGRFEAAQKVATDYHRSVAQALSLGALQKQNDDKMQQRVALVQTSLQEVYQKAPHALQTVLAQTLSLNSETPGAAAGQAPASSQGQAPLTPGDTPASAGVPPSQAPTTSGLPSTGSKSGNEKGEVTTEPTPVKGGVISNPLPEATAPEALPPKDGNPAQPIGPKAGKEASPATGGGAAAEAPKPEPAPVPPASQPPDNLAPKEGGTPAPQQDSKSNSSVQGSASTSFPLLPGSPSR